MRRRVRESRPSPALVIAVLALVAAIAGTAVAGPGATTSKLTKKKVVNIADQEINKLAPGLSVAHANTADTATNATAANNAGNADRLDDLDSTSFLRSDVAQPAVNSANLPNGCSPNDNWLDSSANVNNEVGYSRDQFGRVFLQGVATKCGNPPSGNTIFTLPAGFRPAKLEHFGTVAANAFGAVEVDNSGHVMVAAGDVGFLTGWISLDGLSFRCGPSGSDGCP